MNKNNIRGLPWWFSGWNSMLPMQRALLDLWSGNQIPHAAIKSPQAATRERSCGPQLRRSAAKKEETIKK